MVFWSCVTLAFTLPSTCSEPLKHVVVSFFTFRPFSARAHSKLSWFRFRTSMARNRMALAVMGAVQYIQDKRDAAIHVTLISRYV